MLQVNTPPGPTWHEVATGRSCADCPHNKGCVYRFPLWDGEGVLDVDEAGVWVGDPPRADLVLPA